MLPVPEMLCALGLLHGPGQRLASMDADVRGGHGAHVMPSGSERPKEGCRSWTHESTYARLILSEHVCRGSAIRPGTSQLQPAPRLRADDGAPRRRDYDLLDLGSENWIQVEPLNLERALNETAADT